MIKTHIVICVTIISTIMSTVTGNQAPNDTYPPFEFPPSGYICTEEIAKEYLKWVEYVYSEQCNLAVTADWNYATNITKETEAASIKATTEFLKFQAKIQAEILLKCPNWPDFKDSSTKKQLQYLILHGPGKMCTKDVQAMEELRNKMESLYSTATVCDKDNKTKCDYRLDPEIEEKLGNISDPGSCEHYWTAWHDKMSENVPPWLYAKYVAFQTQMARANGYDDMTEMWLRAYEDGPCWTKEMFKLDIMELWHELFPLYKILHGYIRMKLRRIPEYSGLIDKCGYIPVYLTGNMWAQEWGTLDNITKPFPNASSFDATQAMIDQGYTPLKMFQKSDEFGQSLGLLKMTDTFWEKSMIERPKGRDVVCHASAWDFCNKTDDFRIKQCTKVTMDDFITVHHEMGHIQYYMQYKDQPIMFREGANPGFHEAIGDCLALSMTTPRHLQCVLKFPVGLDPKECKPGHHGSGGNVSQRDLNYLYSTMLKKIMFLPFAISMDSWRWDVFEGKISPDNYNTHWWNLRIKNQGIKPPSDRNKFNLFDPAAKYHICANVEYLRYFISEILQFQFYEAMCIAAGQFTPGKSDSRPLYQCDFTGSKKAGNLLADMLKLGYSKGWPDALEAITGERKMSTASIKKYFEPIVKLMSAELEANGEIPGFGEDCDDVKGKYYQYHKP